jgi:hypothetical protein
LTIILTATEQGQADVAISLVNVDGAVLAETTTTLVVRSTGPGSEHVLGVHFKGVERLERGNVNAARKFFERAAEGRIGTEGGSAGTYGHNL